MWQRDAVVSCCRQVAPNTTKPLKMQVKHNVENICLNGSRGGDKSTHSVRRKRILEVSNSHNGEVQVEEKKH